jgi:hypothetical protein
MVHDDDSPARYYRGEARSVAVNHHGARSQRLP